MRVAAHALGERLRQGLPHVPKALGGEWCGAGSLRQPGNRMSLAPMLGPEVVAMLGALDALPAPPIVRHIRDKWTFIPFDGRTDHQVLAVVLDEATLFEYRDMSGVSQEDRQKLTKYALNNLTKPLEYHNGIAAMVATRVAENPEFAPPRMGPLAPGDTVWLDAGTPIRLLSGSLLCFWWLDPSAAGVDMRDTWERLLNGAAGMLQIKKQGGALVCPAFPALHPFDAYGFMQMPIVDKDTIITRCAPLFPLADPTKLPWLAPAPVAAPPPPPLKTDAALALICNTRTHLKWNEAAVARADEPQTVALKTLLGDERFLTRLGAAAAARNMDTLWDEDGAMRAAIRAWCDAGNVPYPPAPAVEPPAPLPADELELAAPVEAGAGGPAAPKLQFAGFGQEKRCVECGEKEDVYVNHMSEDCFYQMLEDRVQALEAKKGADAKATAKALYARIRACQELELPDNVNGRNIPAAFRAQLQALLDAVYRELTRFHIALPASATDKPSASRRRKRDAEAEGGDDDDDDGDEVDEDDDDDGLVGGDDEEEEEEYVTGEDEDDEEEEDEGDDDDEAGDEPDERNLRDTPPPQASVPKRPRLAESILEVKRQLPLHADVRELEEMFHLGTEASYDAAFVKIDMLRALPCIWRLRRSADEVFSTAYRTREDAERQADQMNMYRAPGTLAYQVYKEDLVTPAAPAEQPE